MRYVFKPKRLIEGIWKLSMCNQNNFMSHAHFFVNIVCLLNINCYFCRSLLSSEESKFLIILLRTVICYIHIWKSANFYSRIVISDGSRASFVYITLLYTQLSVGLSLMFARGLSRYLYMTWVDSSLALFFIYKPSHHRELMRQTRLKRWAAILKRTSSAWCSILSCASP